MSSVTTHLMSITHFKDVSFKAGDGPYLIAEDGEQFLDFFADVGTASLGYHSAEQRDVLREMIATRQPIHAPNLFGYQSRNNAADALCAATGMDRAFFCNSGAEAVEAAIKLARLTQAPSGRKAIYTYKDGFHGRTLATLAAGGPAPTYHREHFGPLPDEFYKFEDIGEIANNACAVLLAPVYGNNDVRVYERVWLHQLRDFCDKTGALLIFDEVQTGSGRTGSVTYGQKLGIKPDIITLAKGIGMGCPVGACLAREPLNFKPGTHWSTFGGNPLSASFVLGMLAWLTPANLAEVNDKGEYIKSKLKGMGWPKNIRGEGMLIAFDIDKDSLQFAAQCLERKLIIGAFRAGPGPVKLTPPLNIDQIHLDDGLSALDEAYTAVK